MLLHCVLAERQDDLPLDQSRGGGCACVLSLRRYDCSHGFCASSATGRRVPAPLTVAREGTVMTRQLPNQSRQPTPGVRLAVFLAPLARRGCALRWAADNMRRLLAIMGIAVFLGSAQTSSAELVSGPMVGIGFRVYGNYYGVYDQYTGIDEVTSDGAVTGRFYWSGVALGSLGRFGTTTRRPLVRQAMPSIAVIAAVLAAVFVLRCFGRRNRLAT